MGLMDSLIVFKNIKGNIREISIDDNILRYKIELGVGDGININLNCANIVKNKENNYFYNKVKNYRNYQDVYFDGIISINIKNNLPKECFSIDEAFKISHPEYHFHVLDISSSSLSDTLDVNVRDAMKLGKECMDYLSAKFRKEKYDKKEFDKKSDKFNEQKNNLTENQKSYIQRYMDARSFDFVN